MQLLILNNPPPLQKTSKLSMLHYMHFLLLSILRFNLEVRFRQQTTNSDYANTHIKIAQFLLNPTIIYEYH